MTVHASQWISSVPLEAPPSTILDADGTPHHGTFAGPLNRVSFDGMRHELHARRAWRATHHKRWLYAFVASKNHVLAVAVVHLGYVATAFAVVVDRRTRSSVFDRSFFTLPTLARVGDTCEEGCDVHFRGPGARISVTRPAGSEQYSLAADAGALSLRATLDTAGSALPIVVVSPVPDGIVNVTEKRVLMPTRGALMVNGRSEPLEDALGGMDYTNGYLARHTAWRWAFAMGRTSDGRPVALNLVDGFNEGRECALWLDGKLIPTDGARFEFQRSHVLAPWKITTPDARVDLTFHGDALHSEELNLGLLRSKFIQPFGSFSGALSVPGQPDVTLEGVPGVVESQDVLW